MSKRIVVRGAGTVEKFDWGTITWGASRALGNSETMAVGTVTIRAGQANPRHMHPNCDEVLHLLGGELEHSLGNERFAMRPGDTISVPAGLYHNARNVGNEDATMVIAFSSADRQTIFEK